MKTALLEIWNWIRLYYADGLYLILAMISGVYLLIREKRLRKNFLIPLILIAFVIVNPVLYKLTSTKIVYWRLLWLIPDAMLIALFTAHLCRSCKKIPAKIAVLLLICTLIAGFGTNVYLSGEITRMQNWYKLPAEVEHVCEILFETAEHPSCIMPAPLLCETRQYSGEIEMMYGRNVWDYIVWASWEQKGMFEAMEYDPPKSEYILRNATQMGYRFVVMYEVYPLEEEALEKYGYEEIAVTDGYRIYYREGKGPQSPRI